MTKKFLILFIGLFAIGGFCLINPEQVKANSDDNVSGFAYSSNIGWISFNSTNCDVDANGFIDSGACGGDNSTTPVIDYGVNINLSTNLFSGYSWSSNIGWIDFAPAPGAYPATPNYSACLDLPGAGQVCDSVGDYTVSGWARACSVFLSGCSGALDPNRGGWDGWIKLRGATQGGSPYGVRLDSVTNQFHDYAWGGDPDSDDEAVIGWISWNCAEGGDDLPGGSDICGTSDYKVVYTPSNDAPNTPDSLEETSNFCAFSAATQVATNTTIVLKWSSFFDLDGDSQEAYEIWLDDNSNFLGSKFNYIADSSSSNEYALNLNYDEEGDWLNQLNWGASYYWKVRVKDHNGAWSDFSTVKSFVMPLHAYPEPMFSWSPDSPAIGEDVQFSNETEFDDGVCENNPDDSSCGYYWTFENADKDYSSEREPIIQFNSMGDSDVTLKSTDSSGYFCPAKLETVSSQVPKPEWKEIPPFGRILRQAFSLNSINNSFKNVVASISNLF